MQHIFRDPLTLAVLALLVGQSLVYIVGGINKQRQQRLSESARAPLRQELVAWGVLSPGQGVSAPAASLLRSWQGITAWSRIGMGVGILFAAGAMLVVLALLSASAQSGQITPPTIQAVTLLLQGYAFGMCCGAILGLLIGAPRVGAASARQTAPAQAPPRLAEYRVRQVALLPGALLLINVALVGGLDLLFLQQFTQAELWTLAVFPGLMLLICLLGEWFTRRLAQLPLRPTDDPPLVARASIRFRARLVGMLLELEIFALFILVICQWLLQTYSSAHPGGFIYNGALLVYAVVLLSMRGLLERAQRQMGDQRADHSAPLPQPAPEAEA
ncbi:MAG TPA: hypothetical protein VH599_14065 [Ktedonobacterales bacterium]|jgi:hypothetical protein